VLDVVNTLALIEKAVWVVELYPALFLTLIYVNRWTTTTLVIRNIPCGWFSLWNDEGVVDDDVLSGA
jgi:hypothetical protein